MSAPTWRKSCHANGTCVEVAAVRHPLSGWAHVLVRNSTRPDGEQLSFLHSDWALFVAEVKAG
jgi:hypothetical protein